MTVEGTVTGYQARTSNPLDEIASPFPEITADDCSVQSASRFMRAMPGVDDALRACGAAEPDHARHNNAIAGIGREERCISGSLLRKRTHLGPPRIGKDQLSSSYLNGQPHSR